MYRVIVNVSAGSCSIKRGVAMHFSSALRSSEPIALANYLREHEASLLSTRAEASLESAGVEAFTNTRCALVQ